MNNIIYTQHIMWYESQMINETLSSLAESLEHSSVDAELIFCLNAQTYIEEPLIGKSQDMFDEFINHQVLKKAKIIYKTNNDPFFNIADWRREMYFPEAKYTIWGESDCLIPNNYFTELTNITIDEPHVLSIASRKMWDSSWSICEHMLFDQLEPCNEHHPNILSELDPLRYYDIIDQETLNKFNNQFPLQLVKLPRNHIDGALLALSKNLIHPFIAPDMHFAREDTCASLFWTKNNIRQYCIKSMIKGHNYAHSKKRTNTSASRSDEAYRRYLEKSQNAMNTFLMSS